MLGDWGTPTLAMGKVKNVLEEMPGVGPSIARDLNKVGIFSVQDLKGKNPEKLYETLCDLEKAKIDPCVLYTFRCAVYYASEKKHDPSKLKWWNWKN